MVNDHGQFGAARVSKRLIEVPPAVPLPTTPCLGDVKEWAIREARARMSPKGDILLTQRRSEAGALGPIARRLRPCSGMVVAPTAART